VPESYQTHITELQISYCQLSVAQESEDCLKRRTGRARALQRGGDHRPCKTAAETRPLWSRYACDTATTRMPAAIERLAGLPVLTSYGLEITRTPSNVYGRVIRPRCLERRPLPRRWHGEVHHRGAACHNVVVRPFRRWCVRADASGQQIDVAGHWQDIGNLRETVMCSVSGIWLTRGARRVSHQRCFTC
jgi:hypothetical protein